MPQNIYQIWWYLACLVKWPGQAFESLNPANGVSFWLRLSGGFRHGPNLAKFYWILSLRLSLEKVELRNLQIMENKISPVADFL